jgi:hypothetical protein
MSHVFLGGWKFHNRKEFEQSKKQLCAAQFFSQHYEIVLYVNMVYRTIGSDMKQRALMLLDRAGTGRGIR